MIYLSARKLQAKFSGSYACFTRPELKAERVSYKILIPILWKPEFRWVIDEIAVLKPIRLMSMIRNEIKSRQSFSLAYKWAQDVVGNYCIESD